MIFRALALALLAAPLAARAETVEVTVDNVRNANGHVRVAICDARNFLAKKCDHDAAVPSQAGTTTLRIDAPPGVYAAQGYLDDHDWGEVRRTLLGLPEQGIGFSRDAPFHFGPPSFDDAKFTVAPGVVTKVHMTLRYFE
jgi:uncharacterized protein (DUF2141 family)